jgi:enamine deaminase RidA (YjgF/YER057c/UK114 family)
VTVDRLPPPGLPPAAGYSHAVVASGRLVVVSGQLPLDARGALVGAGDPTAQVEQVFAHIGAALDAAGARRDHLVRFGFFLLDLGLLPVVRSVRDRFLGDVPPPASTLVQVAGLVVPGALLEVEALAVVDD